jgi:hypothetical protein
MVKVLVFSPVRQLDVSCTVGGDALIEHINHD